MRVPRAALASLGLSLGLLLGALVARVRPLGAQDQPQGWNDDRTMELVRAATARRSAQLADTGLRDYTARATGYLTLLMQLGEGFLSPPALVRSDQIAIEVYWGAPDHSKQRIIGRRDTLLLPTDIVYHRDHLGIIQNNFPETIRLGDGDEVRDVPHPLSALGQRTYDYQIADSLAIRTVDRAIDVMMISVRPKDDRAAAAVGAVYIDRQSASVVRMTFSFTRAALRDRQLEDVSVILENGLVEGRFWLPRRQEIEIRRSASWMDFPVRGIIRGRWEICCIVTNSSSLPQIFAGPEIIETSPQQQRDFPFPGQILDELPEEVRALDAEEVRAVQEEARRLVRAGALARARGTVLSARAASDVLRFDRVEGLAVGGGLTQRLGGGFSLSGTTRYGFSDEQLKGRGVLTWRHASGLSLSASAIDDFAAAGDVAEVSGLRNSIAAQEFGSDWTDPYGVRGGALRVQWQSATGMRLFVEGGGRAERALAIHAAPATGAFAQPLAVVPLDRRSLTLGWEVARVMAGGTEARGGVTVVGSEIEPVAGPSARVARAALDFSARMPVAAGRVVARTIAAGASAGQAVPLQDAVFFGGPVTGPGLGFHALTSGVGVSQRLEWQSRIPFVAINLGRFGRVPSSIVLAPYVHGVWVDRPIRGEAGWHPSVGLGAIGLFELLRVDVARGLRDGRWLFTLDVAREFWPVM